MSLESCIIGVSIAVIVVLFLGGFLEYCFDKFDLDLDLDWDCNWNKDVLKELESDEKETSEK
jgi:hypothetical protein